MEYVEMNRWTVNFYIDFALNTSQKLEWKKEGMISESKDNLKGTLIIESGSDQLIKGTIILLNDLDDEKIVRNEAKRIMQKFLDMYFLLTNDYLRLKEISSITCESEGRLKHYLQNDVSVSATIGKPINSKNLDNSLDLFEKNKIHTERERMERVFRWFRRGIEDSDKVDRFISYWISFNALYGYYKNNGEKNAFFDTLEEHISKNIAKNILDVEKNNISSLVNGNIVKRNKKGLIKEKLSEKLEDYLEKKDYKNALKYAVWCIYQVRCNVFHGDKEYIDFINAGIPILRYVIRECLKSFVFNIDRCE